MKREKLNRLRDFWRTAKWVVWGLIAGAFVTFVVFYLLPSTRSRWNAAEEGKWTVFTEAAAPRAESRAFLSSYPAAAEGWYRDIGLAAPAPESLGLITFAAWGGYGALDMNDPRIKARLSSEPSSDLRFVAMAAKSFRLNEPIASSFVTNDGRYLFLDLKGDTGAAVVHGLAHVLARRNVPPAIAGKIGYASGPSYDPVMNRSFKFIDETAALFLSDLFLSGAKSTGPDALGRYGSFIAARYAPEGPVFMDENLSFTFSSDPRTPRYFAGAARLALGVSKEKGLAAMVEFCSRFLSGRYDSFDELCAPLGGNLGDLLERHLGSRAVPE
jgi:hypothetical protein